ncbi:MAG: tetratricopeptide repeat protein [Polyangiaceae bacterium]
MYSPSRILFVLAFVNALAWESHGAAADSTATGTPRAVVALCDEALAHVRKGEFDAARKLYAKAFDVAPSASILFNLALSELNAGDALDALRHFREYVQAADAEPKKVARTQSEFLPRAYAATGHLEVHFDNVSAEAKLYLDSERIVYVPAGILDVAPGEHFVGAATADMGWCADVHAVAGKTTPAVLQLVWVHSGMSVDAGAPVATASSSDAGRRQ